MMRFVEWPSALALAVLLPILGIFIVTAEQRSRERRRAKLGTPSMLARLAPFAARLGPWRTFRITAALACCSLAFAGPRWGVDSKLTYSTGIDVAVAMDASLSMMAPDVQPTRLDNMKNVVRQLRAALPTDRFAMLAFADHSYLLSPLTTDQGALDMYLDDLDTATVGVRGTSLSSAIDQAVTLLGGELGGEPDDSSRAIVLLSDGESFEPIHDILAAAERARNAGIVLITVGFGTERGSKIPVLSRQGAMTDMRDSAGQVVVTHYMPSLLKEATRAAHGIFIPADAPDKADQISRVVAELNPATRATRTGETLLPRFQWFIIPAILLLMLETLLVLRPRRVVVTAVAAALMVGATTACERSPTGQAPPSVPRARRPDYANMMIYNRGTKLLLQDKLRDAVPPLDSAAASRDRVVDFRASFNSGWSSLVSAMRLKKALGSKGRARGNDAVDSAALSAATAATVVGRASAGTPPSSYVPDEPLTPARKAVLDSISAMVFQLDNARAKYRTALLANPNDMDAKWNYELASLHSKIAKANQRKYAENRGRDAGAGKGGLGKGKGQGKGKGKGKGNGNGNGEGEGEGKGQGKGQGKGKGKGSGEGKGQGTGRGTGRGTGESQWQKQYSRGLQANNPIDWRKEDPPVEKLRIPQQEAEQILNAVGPRALRAPTAPPNTRTASSRPPW